MQAKITYYNPFSTDLSALPSVVISFNRAGGDSDVEVVQASGPSRTAVMSQAAVTGALAAKTDAVAGKGLSANDYTTTERNKLAALPGAVYSKTEIDDKLPTAGGGSVIGPDEVQAGVFCMAGSAGEVRQPIYSRLTVAAGLPKTAGQSAEYLLSDDPLGCNLYFTVDSLTISAGERLRSEMFLSLYEITKVYVDEQYRTKLVVRCRETTEQELTAHICVRYIKPYAEKVELEIDCAEDVSAEQATVAFPSLKYDKKALVSFTTDDASATSFCRVWAAINGRPVSSKYYHANQLEADDVPDSIVETTLSKTLGFTDGCGNDRRFRHGVAIWPYSQANGSVMMDTTSPVDKTAGNTYRFMNPYLQWGDLKEMVKYGTGVYHHNIGTEQFGSDRELANVQAGLLADCDRCIERIGRGIKILARPDGNNTYLDAAAASPRILFAVAENTPAADILPAAAPALFRRVGMRLFPVSASGLTEQEVVKTRFAEEYAKPAAQRKWFHFCCHTADLAWVNLLVWFNDNYGKDGSDDIWFASVDEVYEYMHILGNTLVRKSAEGRKLRITAYIPKGQYFYHPDFSLLVSGVGNVAAVSASDNVKGLAWSTREGGILLNASTDTSLETLAEEFTARFETQQTAVAKTDALYFASQLRESLRAPFAERIEAVQPGAVILHSIRIDAGAATTTSRQVSIQPAFDGTPAHYRIGENADLAAQTWAAYTGGAIAFTLSEGYGLKTIYLQLSNAQGQSAVKSAAITYREASAEVPLTALSIGGPAALTEGESASLTLARTPADTTQTGVAWSSSAVAVATVDTTGRVTAVTAGSVVITARSTDNNSIAATHGITVNAAVSENNAAIFANYTWLPDKVDHLFDAKQGKYLNIANNNNSTSIATANQVYDMNTGVLIPGWSRLSNDDKKAYYSLAALDNWTMAASYDPDLSDLFGTPLSYEYSFRYNSVAYNVIGWNVPNGTYKISILSSTSQTDVSTTAHIKINNVEQTLPALSLQNNKQWMEFSGIVVADGKIAILMHGDTNKRIGYNAIKIEKS